MPETVAESEGNAAIHRVAELAEPFDRLAVNVESEIFARQVLRLVASVGQLVARVNRID